MVNKNYIHSLGTDITKELDYLAIRVNKADKIIQLCYELVFCPTKEDQQKIEKVQRDLKRYCKKYVV